MHARFDAEEREFCATAIRIGDVPERTGLQSIGAGVLDRLGIQPSDFVMVGNSIRSDVLPVLGIGGRAVHVPHTTTWILEEPDPKAVAAVRFPVVDRLADLPALLADWTVA